MSEYIKQSAKVWTPNYPRRCATPIGSDWGQITVHGQEELLYNLKQVSGDFPGYVSTYSFPNGHPTDDPDNLPLFDTLLTDFDVDFDKDQFNYEEWKRKLGDLLTRLRLLSKELVEADLDKYWRASLSGFKGVHLYLDFPQIDNDLGQSVKYENGMSNYTDSVVRGLKEESGINDLEEYVDVSSGWDFARLTRLPNTIHEKATKAFNETRYCVPVSIKELQKIGVKEYVALCRSQREVPEDCYRDPLPEAKERAEEYIRRASAETWSETRSASIKDPKKYKHYVNEVANERVELDDVRFLLKRKPCIWEFAQNRHKFDHGNSSHLMEMQCIIAMASIGTPIDVMHDFFKEHPEKDVHPRYDAEETDKRIKEVLSRDYGEFNCSSILEDAPQFCLKQNCKIYRDNDDLQRIH